MDIIIQPGVQSPIFPALW